MLQEISDFIQQTITRRDDIIESLITEEDVVDDDDEAVDNTIKHAKHRIKHTKRVINSIYDDINKDIADHMDYINIQQYELNEKSNDTNRISTSARLTIYDKHKEILKRNARNIINKMIILNGTIPSNIEKELKKYNRMMISIAKQCEKKTR